MFAIVLISMCLGLSACLFSSGPNTLAEGWQTDPFLVQDEAKSWFVQDTLPLLDFVLTEDQKAALEADPLSEEYQSAQLVIGGRTLPAVGLRYKGSWGSLKRCFEDGIMDSSYCPKLSLKVKFDAWDSNQRFVGLKKLNLHALNGDPSKLHDLTAYEAFRRAGIHAPRAFPCRVRVNGQDRGVFLMVEEVDGRFAESRFREGNGKIYKEVWPILAKDTAEYKKALASNAGDSGVQAMFAFAQSLQDPLTRSQYVDLQTMSRYLAVDEWIENWDGITTWYCWGSDLSSCNNHNFYWYQESTRPFFHLIPWDMDQTFQNTNPWANRPAWDDTTAACEIMAAGEEQQMPASCDPLIRELVRGSQLQERLKQRKWVLEHVAKSPALLASVDRWVNLLRPWVLVDVFNPGRSSWEMAVQNFKRSLSSQTAKLEVRAQGLQFEEFGLDPDQLNTLSGWMDAQFQMGVIQQAGAPSQMSFELDTLLSNPAMRLNFAYQDAPLGKAWSFWIHGVTKMKPQSTLLGKSKFKFRIKSDSCRNVRVEMATQGTTEANSGAYWGWEIEACQDWKEYELAISDLEWCNWCSDIPQDSLNQILRSPLGIRWSPSARQVNGWIGAAKVDSGSLWMDDLEWK